MHELIFPIDDNDDQCKMYQGINRTGRKEDERVTHSHKLLVPWRFNVHCPYVLSKYCMGVSLLFLFSLSILFLISHFLLLRRIYRERNVVCKCDFRVSSMDSPYEEGRKKVGGK